MKPIIYVLCAVVLYSVTNLVLEQKFSKLHQSTVLLGAYPVMLAMAFIWYTFFRPTGEAVSLPNAPLMMVIGGVALAWFFGDFFFVGAYTEGGNMLTITTLFIMFPVVGALIKYAWSRELPTGYHIAGWLVAAVAVLLVTKGEMLRQTPS